MRTRSTLRWIAMIGLLIALSGCGNTVREQNRIGDSTPIAVGTMPFISEPDGPASLKLLPLSVQSVPAESGWRQYTVAVALENGGQGLIQLVRVSDNGIVQTTEGFTYNVTPADFGGGAEISLPPGFRVLGASFRFKAAETAHPTQVKFDKFGVVDLTTTVKPLFPADTLPSPLHPLSDGMQTKDTKITFKKVRQATATVTVMDVLMENVNTGYANTHPTPGCSVIDSQGNVSNLNINEAVELGPGKSTEKTFGFTKQIPDSELGKAVMLCYNNYDLKSGTGSIELFRLQ